MRIECTEDEAKLLLMALDAALRHAGLQAAEAAVIWHQKLRAAAIQTEPMPQQPLNKIAA